MLEDRFINITRRELEDFDTLREIIHNNSAEKLAISFMMMHFAKEAYDRYVSDKTQIIAFTVTTEDLLKASRETVIFPALEQLGSTAHWAWVEEVKNHIDEYVTVYDMLSDAPSRDALRRIMLSRFFLDAAYFEPIYKLEYYDWSFLVKRDSAVFVDCGAYNGDSVLSFIEHYGENYEKIYAYEPTPDIFEQLEKAVAAYPRIETRSCAVGEREGTVTFNLNIAQGQTGNFVANGHGNGGNITVPVISLDNEIKEPISFIKMDIEGSELDALRGAKCHIVNDKPQIAVSAYHTFKDLRTIPLLIHSYNKNQRFYFRNHQWGGEMSFYADPCL
jgi:FkbM family methyltransferase